MNSSKRMLLFHQIMQHSYHTVISDLFWLMTIPELHTYICDKSTAGSSSIDTFSLACCCLFLVCSCGVKSAIININSYGLDAPSYASSTCCIESHFMASKISNCDSVLQGLGLFYGPDHDLRTKLCGPDSILRTIVYGLN